MQKDSHNLRENAATMEKYILRKMDLNFHKKANETTLEQVIVAE